MVGNFVGTDVNGARAIANGQAGILLTAETTTSGASSKNIVGGTTPAERNLISGNTLDGIQIAAGSNENIIQGNYIGTNSTASAAVPNKNSGISVINAPRNTIGGVTTSAGSGAGNLITGNTFHGIIIVNFGSIGNNVLGNVIGADVDSCGGTTFGNSLYGIRIRDASNNKIGGVQDGQRNVIANNGQSGVQVIATTAAAGNSIRGNTLQDNGG